MCTLSYIFVYFSEEAAPRCSTASRCGMPEIICRFGSQWERGVLQKLEVRIRLPDCRHPTRAHGKLQKCIRGCTHTYTLTQGLKPPTQEKKSKLSANFNSIKVYHKKNYGAIRKLNYQVKYKHSGPISGYWYTVYGYAVNPYIYALIHSAEKQMRDKILFFNIKYFPIQFLCGLGVMLHKLICTYTNNTHTKYNMALVHDKTNDFLMFLNVE